ncbi:MAG: S9 family peptidase, partial [Lachnospiraceae bacterium]|nr:S9 family peptidase [Lachnospiraceae bacterium]
MKEIRLEQFTEFTFPSNLNISSDERKLYVVLTKTDMEENAYQQQLIERDIISGEIREITPWKKGVGYHVLKDGVYVVDNDPERKGVFTTLKKITDQGLEEAFELPIAAGRILEWDEDLWIVSSQINRSCPDFYAMSEEERKEVTDKRKEEEDYIVFDEYPFVYNGAGVINGNRTSLFTFRKSTKEVRRITPETFDVGSFEIISGKLIFTANDFTTFKSKWDWIYEIDPISGKITVLYDKKMAVHGVFEEKGKIYVRGTFARDYGEMEASKFYELKDGEMVLRVDTEDSFFNSTGSDSRYGRNRNQAKFGGVNYFINTIRDHSVLMKLENDVFEMVAETDGCIDGFALSKDRLFVIAMLGQQLEELYEVKDGKYELLSNWNTEVFADTYVAKPEKVIVKKAVDIEGWVLKPINFDPSKKYPGILDIHGGPKSAYGEIYYHEMQLWASRGYFVFYCNPRGSDGRGNAFADLRHQFGGIDYQDIMAFVRK